MKIQIASYPEQHQEEQIDKDGVIYFFSTLGQPKSLDEFDINIINLTSENLWKYKETTYTSIDDINDLAHIGTMIGRSQKSVTVVVFPCNTVFNYYYHSSRYLKNIELKNCLANVSTIISKLAVEAESLPVLFENTVTEINGIEYLGTFYFEDAAEPLTKSRNSEKITSLKASERVIFTTLNPLESTEHILTFLKKCNLISEKEDYPQWLTEYHILDDKKLCDDIAKQKSTIEAAKSKICNAKKKLEENLEYKSILSTNGDSLVKSVFMILEQVLNIDLSDFEDKNREDFLIPLSDNLEFIGEIKGVTSNIKLKDVSQLRVHRHSRLEELDEEGVEKEVKALLIMNPLRTTPINERDSVHKKQIDLALKDESLIVETKTLLRVYELVILQSLSPESCRDMLLKEKGLLTEKTIKKYIK
jgi:hypothetical protein